MFGKTPLFIFSYRKTLKAFILANFKIHIADLLISHNIVLISREIFADCNGI